MIPCAWPQTADPQTADPQIAPLRQTVVVTGTFDPLTLEELDRSLTLLPVRGDVLPPASLADLLKFDPSLDLQQRAPGGIQGDLSIRGAPFSQTLVLVNGLRMNDAQTGHHSLDIPVPTDGIERVEVLRGSGSTEYGADAMGGVVNIIAAPPEGSEIRLRGAVGNDGINRQSVSLAGSLSRISEQLTFSRAFSSGFMPDRDYRNLSLASTTRFTTGWGASDVILAYRDNPFGADQFYGPYPSWEDTKSWLASWRQELGRKTSASFAYRRHSDLFVLYRDRPAVYANHHADCSWQAALHRTEEPAPNVRISYGVEGLRESIASTNLGIHTRSRGAAYAALDFRALKRFSLSLAAREEAYRRWRGDFSPTIAAGFWLGRGFKLRASASRAFRIASYTELYYSDPANAGNANLRPERAWTYEGGLEWRGNSRLRADVAVFERRVRDGIDYYRASTADLWHALNILSQDFTGAEAALGVRLGAGNTLDFRYSLLHGSQAAIPIGNTKYSFNYPTDSGTVVWQGQWKGVAARSRVGVMNRRGRAAYGVWDINAGRARGRVRPFLELSNMTGTRYQEIVSVWMPGREVVGGIEWLAWKR